MKRRSGLAIVFGASAAIALAGVTLAFSGLTNGDFETGAYADGGSGFEQLNAGDTSLDGWTVDSGSVDWIGSYWPAEHGTMSIDLSGADAGTISQTFATTIGNTYTVSFALSGNPAGEPVVKTLDVTATGATPASYTFDSSVNTLTDMTWTTETYSFLATSASTTLSFVSTTPGAYGPALDDVVVSEKVPTKDECKLGGWQSMIDNAGNTFKNQGDCVSYFATKGKNLGAGQAAATDESATADADAADASPKHAAKHKATSTERHTTAGHAAKVKTKTHAHSHGSSSHKHK